MKHLAKRTLSLLLAALMVLSLIPASTHVHAATGRVATASVETGALATNEYVSEVATVCSINSTYKAWQMASGKTLQIYLTEEFLADFSGKATVEIVFLTNVSGVAAPDASKIHYANSAGGMTVIPTPSVETLSTNYSKATVTLEDAGFAYNYNSKKMAIQIAAPSGKTIGIQSVTITEIIEETPEYAPEFNEADFTANSGYVFDELASPALTIKNPDNTVAMTARVYVTLKKDGVDVEGLVQKRVLNGEVPTAEALELISSATMTSVTKAEGTYQVVVNSFISVDGGEEYQVDKTLSFQRRNTFTQRFYEENGDLYYAVQVVTGAESVYPNNFRITITGGELTEDKVVEALDYQYGTAAETVKNLTADVMSDLEPGEYTVKIEAYRGSTLRSTRSYTYTIEAPAAFVPEFGTISTVLDNAAVPELTITNPGETSEMTTAIKATLKLNGELHPNVQNVSVGPDAPVAAGQTATLISSELLSKYATAMGNWEIVLTGTVTVDEVPYEVSHTVSFARTQTFTHSVEVSDGNIYYNAKAVSEEAVAYAPNGVKIYVEDAEGETVIAGPSTQAITLTTADNYQKLNGLGIIANLEPGTYTIKVEAYKTSELRGTTTCAYTVAAACEHPSVSDLGDCTATTTVTCPDCQEPVTVKAAHAYENYTESKAATCVDNAEETGKCANCEATDTREVEDTATGVHTYTDDEDITCNNCDYVRTIHYGSNVTLGNSIDVNVTVSVPDAKVEEYKAYAQMANGEKVEVDLVQNVTNYYDVTLPGLAAKELCNEITVTVYDENGDEVLNVVESFAKYAKRLLESEANAKDKKMIADMVAYAAAAQEYFGYKTGEKSVIDQLADLNVDYTTYTDAVTPPCENNRTEDDVQNIYSGSNFTLEDNITMNMYVKDIDGIYAEISYVDYLGNTQEWTIQNENSEVSGSYRKFKIDRFVTADGAGTVVTAKFYNAEDELLATITDSMASYVARAGAVQPWLYTMLKYANSAYAALTD